MLGYNYSILALRIFCKSTKFNSCQNFWFKHM